MAECQNLAIWTLWNLNQSEKNPYKKINISLTSSGVNVQRCKRRSWLINVTSILSVWQREGPGADKKLDRVVDCSQ